MEKNWLPCCSGNANALLGALRAIYNIPLRSAAEYATFDIQNALGYRYGRDGDGAVIDPPGSFQDRNGVCMEYGYCRTAGQRYYLFWPAGSHLVEKEKTGTHSGPCIHGNLPCDPFGCGMALAP